jgi:hypothetical protein
MNLIDGAFGSGRVKHQRVLAPSALLPLVWPARTESVIVPSANGQISRRNTIHQAALGDNLLCTERFNAPEESPSPSHQWQDH